MIIRILTMMLLGLHTLDLCARESRGGKHEGDRSQGGAGHHQMPSSGRYDNGPPAYGMPGSPVYGPGNPAAPVASPYGGRERIYKGLPSTQKTPGDSPRYGSYLKMPSGYIPGPGAGSYGESRESYELRRSGKSEGAEFNRKSEPKGGPSSSQLLKGDTGIKRAESAPAIQKAMSRLEPGYEQPAAKPSQVQVEFRSAASRMQEALDRGDYQKVATEAQAIKSRASNLRGRLRELKLEKRLEVGSIIKMYDQGTAMIHEGQLAQEDAMVRMGIQRISEATESLERLENK